MQLDAIHFSLQLAEQSISYYASMMLQTTEKVSFEGFPDEMESMIMSMIASLHQLSDRAEIDWMDVITQAEDEYMVIKATIPPL